MKKTKLDGVRLIHGMSTFHDLRGMYGELYSKKDYGKAGIVEFVSHTFSRSKKNVLRGLHGDTRTWKLVSCPIGSFYIVVVNCVPGSKQLHQWEGFTLTEELDTQVLIPPGFGNGHLILSEHTIFHYLQSHYYRGQGKQFTLRWNDPALGIRWPIKKKPILSKRDAEAPFLQE